MLEYVETEGNMIEDVIEDGWMDAKKVLRHHDWQPVAVHYQVSKSKLAEKTASVCCLVLDTSCRGNTFLQVKCGVTQPMFKQKGLRKDQSALDVSTRPVQACVFVSLRNPYYKHLFWITRYRLRHW